MRGGRGFLLIGARNIDLFRDREAVRAKMKRGIVIGERERRVPVSEREAYRSWAHYELLIPQFKQ